MNERPPLSWPIRVAAWDAALGAVRSYLRAEGLREVVTPLRVGAVAIEPFIEPMVAPPGLLATSPELQMKRLLCRGAPSIFQIAPCFRAAEHGDLHREEFHMVEWYRVGEDADVLRDDVQAIVEAVHVAVAEVLDEDPIAAPRTWTEVGALEAIERTLGLKLRGDEDAADLAAAIEPVSASLGHPLATVHAECLERRPRAHALWAWTVFFSAFCDAKLDPWLREHPSKGMHIVEFPVALAALSEVGPSARGEGRGGRVAYRFESYAGGCELANGYRELRDPEEQQLRFADVNALRASLELPPLTVDIDFIDDLRAPGLPKCSGVALGLDRLVLLASGRRRLADVAIELGAASR